MPLFSIEQTYTKELYHEYAWCAYDKQIESAWNSNKAIQNRHFRVDFYDDYFQTISDNGTNKISYDTLYGFMESEHTAALMLGNNNGYMLNKGNMPHELITFLKSKVKEIK